MKASFALIKYILETIYKDTKVPDIVALFYLTMCGGTIFLNNLCGLVIFKLYKTNAIDQYYLEDEDYLNKTKDKPSVRRLDIRTFIEDYIYLSRPVDETSFYIKNLPVSDISNLTTTEKHFYDTTKGQSDC